MKRASSPCEEEAARAAPGVGGAGGDAAAATAFPRATGPSQLNPRTVRRWKLPSQSDRMHERNPYRNNAPDLALIAQVRHVALHKGAGSPPMRVRQP
jgi:hypothetical protein